MKRTTENPWHYPRAELTEHVFGLFKSGLVRRLALFAPRRKGKTWFLLKDLVPAATKRNYLPVYASLWGNPNAPHEPILQALEQALVVAKARRAPWKRYLSGLEKLTVSAGIVSASWAPRATDPASATPAQLARLRTLLEELVTAAPQGRVLLLLDEAQHMATAEAFRPLTASLRTALDTLDAASDGLRTLFTGSSRTDLSALLRDPKAPFYRSVEQIDLPDFDRGYTDFVCRQLQQLGRQRVNRDVCWEVFSKLHCSPFYMEAVIREVMLRRARTLEQAYEHVVRGIVEDPYYADRWHALKPLDQLVYIAIAEGDSIYSQAELKAFSKELGQKVGSTLVQRSAGRLKRLGMVSSTTRGEYRNEDPELLTWLRHRR